MWQWNVLCKIREIADYWDFNSTALVLVLKDVLNYFYVYTMHFD